MSGNQPTTLFHLIADAIVNPEKYEKGFVGIDVIAGTEIGVVPKQLRPIYGLQAMLLNAVADTTSPLNHDPLRVGIFATLLQIETALLVDLGTDSTVITGDWRIIQNPVFKPEDMEMVELATEVKRRVKARAEELLEIGSDALAEDIRRDEALVPPLRNLN